MLFCACGDDSSGDEELQNQVEKLAFSTCTAAMMVASTVVFQAGELPKVSSLVTGTAKDFTIKGTMPDALGKGSAKVTGNGNMQSTSGEDVYKCDMSVDFAGWRSLFGYFIDGVLPVETELKVGVSETLKVTGTANISGQYEGTTTFDLVCLFAPRGVGYRTTGKVNDILVNF